MSSNEMTYVRQIEGSYRSEPVADSLQSEVVAPQSNNPTPSSATGLGLLILSSGKTVLILPSQLPANQHMPQPVHQPEIRYMPYAGLINTDKVTPRDAGKNDETVIFNRIKVYAEWGEESKKRKEPQEKKKNKRTKRDLLLQALLQSIGEALFSPLKVFTLSHSLMDKKAKRSDEKSKCFLPSPTNKEE
jgi:hypothetical protein